MYSSTRDQLKNQVYQEWFELQYTDPSRTELVPVKANFRIDWHTLNIIKKDTIVKLGIKLGTKRIPVYHGDAWVDTDPIDIKDNSFLDHVGKEKLKSLRNYVIQLQIENRTLNEKFSIIEKGIAERYREIIKYPFDANAKKITDNRMQTQSTSDIVTCITEDITLLDKEEKSTSTEVNKDDNILTDEKIPPTRRKWTMFPDIYDK